MSRKPFSVVAVVLAPNCSSIENTSLEPSFGTIAAAEPGSGEDVEMRVLDPYKYEEGWPPFNGTHCQTLLGSMTYTWLFSYALFMYISGLIGERMDLRYFLASGMCGSGVMVGLLGVAYYLEIHHIIYFIAVQLLVGIFESTGWPGVLAVMGNWFGKTNRGLILGIWSTNSAVGNILGTVIPSIWAKPGQPWGWSFLALGLAMIGGAAIIFLFLIVEPAHVGLPLPDHHPDDEIDSLSVYQSNGDGNSKLSSQCTNVHCFPRKTAKTGLQNNKEKLMLVVGLIAKENTTEGSSLTEEKKKKEIPISFVGALQIPGVIEFSISLFFTKMVTFTFLFWLPYYLTYHRIGGEYIGEQNAAFMSVAYDVGGIMGGIASGALSDFLSARAIVCSLMMYLAVPTLFLFHSFGMDSVVLSVVLIVLSGMFIGSSYSLIMSAVSIDLGTHKSLNNNQKAKSTVGAIITATGSMGAGCGPLLAGWLSDEFGWRFVFFTLMGSCFLSAFVLSRIIVLELNGWYQQLKQYRREVKGIYEKPNDEANSQPPILSYESESDL